MEYRKLGRTGWNVSEISFGAWAIGSTWGNVDDNESMAALRCASENGVNLFDTADVYGDGRSEKLLAKLKKESQKEFYIATKAGRMLNPHTSAGYNRKNLTEYVESSLGNLGVESIDLLQLHCPPPDLYYMPEVFQILDDLVKDGKIRYYGVSVEKVEEALKAIEYPNVQSIQIIFNMFRQRPSELFFEQAKKRQVGILARLPLSSGMLTGKFTEKTVFEKDDHRDFNRNGEAFDRGETFSGIDYSYGLSVVEKLKRLCPQNMNMAQFALRWILMFDAVTCAIPGAKRIEQVNQNVAAANMPPFSDELIEKVRAIYEDDIKGLVHHYW